MTTPLLNTAPLLEIESLTVAYYQGKQWLDAVRDVNLTVGVGETVGLVGESGSGKSTLAHAVLRYLSAGGAIRQGQIRFQGQDIEEFSPAQLRQFWRDEIKLVPQDALSSLNPSLTIGDQVLESIPPNQEQSWAQMLEMLRAVRLADPERVAQSYPHQLSGGMQQRVMIAMALTAEPSLLVMDEPTTALDVTTEAAILDLVAGLIRDRQTAVLYVTHNLNVVAQICDRVAVLYAGELVEDAPASRLFSRPLHPYTAGLLAGVPQVGRRKGSRRLNPIQGSIPQLTELPAGCVFAPRCPVAVARCHEERPPLEEPISDESELDARGREAGAVPRSVRCFLWPDIASGEVKILDEEQPNGKSQERGAKTLSPDETPPAERERASGTQEPVLRLRDLQKRFDVARSPVQWLTGTKTQAVRAVDGIDLKVEPGHTLGLVGESGSGKTTLARCIIGLEEASGGEMRLLDVPLVPSLDGRPPAVLRQLQIVFQNPDEALNPYRTVADTLRRPLARLAQHSRNSDSDGDRNAARNANGVSIEARIEQLLEMVNLRPELANRLPDQLSGGEKQRVAIARAFAAQPELLIFDESVSALDVSVQASILNLLNELQEEQGRAYLFITHDLGVVSYLADELAVIYLGRLMDVGRADGFFSPPYHPYTEALLAAAPTAATFASRAQAKDADTAPMPTTIRLSGEIPSPSQIPQGCPFHTRCPRYVGDICATETPPWREGADGRRIFCHIPLDELATLQQEDAQAGTAPQAAQIDEERQDKHQRKEER